MTFLYVLEVPEHKITINYSVAMCMCVCRVHRWWWCVCVCVFVCHNNKFIFLTFFQTFFEFVDIFEDHHVKNPLRLI